ncbi:hypothetical protein C0J52_26467, partial [Blattella germanica]
FYFLFFYYFKLYFLIKKILAGIEPTTFHSLHPCLYSMSYKSDKRLRTFYHS